jgi:hypothetical protein
MRLVEAILRMEVGRQRRMMEEAKVAKIYYKHFCKCHNIPQHNNNMIKII